jgi:hypothetical protein
VEWELLKVEPTSIEGAAALLAYAAEFEREDNMWGDYEEGSWSCHLHEMLADALGKMTAAA